MGRVGTIPDAKGRAPENSKDGFLKYIPLKSSKIRGQCLQHIKKLYHI